MVADGVAERVRAAQERAIVGYVREHVAPFSPIHHQDLGTFRSLKDLDQVPVRSLADIDDPRSLVLRPTEETISSRGPLSLRARLWWAQLVRGQESLNRTVLEPAYKPIHWHTDAPVPLGYSAADLDRLSEIGRAGLELAGVGPYDSLVGLVEPGPYLGYWQLILGARRGGVPSVHLDPGTAATVVADFRPTVVAGTSDVLIRVATEDPGRLESAERFVVVGDPPTARDRVEAAVGPRPVFSWWAPGGTRALWTECAGRTGLHSWAATELVEVVEPLSGRPAPGGGEGELVWSPIGWKGSVLLRTRTGASGRVDEGTCPGCGRSSPRVTPAIDRLVAETNARRGRRR